MIIAIPIISDASQMKGMTIALLKQRKKQKEKPKLQGTTNRPRLIRSLRNLQRTTFMLGQEGVKQLTVIV